MAANLCWANLSGANRLIIVLDTIGLEALRAAPPEVGAGVNPMTGVRWRVPSWRSAVLADHHRLARTPGHRVAATHLRLGNAA